MYKNKGDNMYEELIKDKNILGIFNEIDNNNDIRICHGLNHVLNVINNIEKLCPILEINEEDKNLLKIAAYLHDIGHRNKDGNHYDNSSEFAENYLKNKLDEKSLNKIVTAIKSHHEKEKINELDLFSHILLFSDKMDFTYKRLNPNYINNNNEYIIEKDIKEINFDIKENDFIITIITNDLDIDKFKEWLFFPKIRKRCEEFAKKINKNLILNITKEYIVYHVVIDRPMHLNQKIIFDENNQSGVYKRVMEKEKIVKDIYNNKEKYKNTELEHHTKVALRELALEEIRQKEYPNYPSRLKSLYVSEKLEDSYNWADYFIKLNRKVLQIVKLKINGNIFKGDAHNCFDGTTSHEENIILSRKYWNNEPNTKNEIPLIETLVSGDIEVIEIIKEY